MNGGGGGSCESVEEEENWETEEGDGFLGRDGLSREGTFVSKTEGRRGEMRTHRVEEVL